MLHLQGYKANAKCFVDDDLFSAEFSLTRKSLWEVKGEKQDLILNSIMPTSDNFAENYTANTTLKIFKRMGFFTLF